MTVKEVVNSLGLTLLCGTCEREFSGVYVGDLLSRAMSRVEADNLWITIMSNVNVVAVATLTEPACIILAEDVDVAAEVLEAAQENGITMAKSPLDAYTLCVKLHELSGIPS